MSLNNVIPGSLFRSTEPVDFSDILRQLFPTAHDETSPRVEDVERRFVVDSTGLNIVEEDKGDHGKRTFVNTGDLEPRWFNSLGEEVDLDDIDRNYALNILHMRLNRMGVVDPLNAKLLDVVRNGREPDHEDRRRAVEYNVRNAMEGKPFRARV